MKKLLGIVVLSLLLIGKVNADEKLDYVFSNLQMDFSDCYAYYKISEEGVKRSKSKIKDNAEKKLGEAAQLAMDGAFLIGEKINMKPEAMTSRIKLSIDDMYNKIDGDYVNISILIDEYGYLCRDLINDTKSRIEYWKNRYGG